MLKSNLSSESGLSADNMSATPMERDAGYEPKFKTRTLQVMRQIVSVRSAAGHPRPLLHEEMSFARRSNLGV